MLNLIPIQYRMALKAGTLFIWSLALFVAGAYVQSLHDTVVAQNLEIKTKQQALDDAEKIRILTNENMLKKQESHAYADFIDKEYNDKVQELHTAKSDINSLTSANSRLRQKSICDKNSTGGVSKSGDTGLGSQNAEGNEAGFSREFIEFLISQWERDDKNIIWAEGIEESFHGDDPRAICKQEGVICK